MGIFESIPLSTVIIVLIVCIPTLIKWIKAIIGYIKSVKTEREALIEEGRKIERASQAANDRFSAGEARITKLESEEADLETRLQTQEKLLSLLIESDQLNIKAWIKSQHEKWMAKKYIDSQSLDLLEARYKIYVREDGNSWAEKLMNDLRALPIVTTVTDE